MAASRATGEGTDPARAGADDRHPRRIILAALLASAVALAVAPAAMPASYSWVAHTTSESAAQGVDAAWIARLGFLAFGAAVVALAAFGNVWRSWGARLHAAFGVLMMAAAVFSARSWEAGAPYDATEDLLHSAAATGLGFAFALGVAAVAWAGVRRGQVPRLLDLVALAAAVVVPLGMLAVGGAAGVLQRAMFTVAYGWYGREALAAGSGKTGTADA